MSVLSEQYAGFNVTIPHKEAIMRYLDEVDDRARAIGAVNTVVREGGRLIGYNTDWIGFTQALIEGAGQRDSAFVQHKPVLVIGAGGAARAVCYAVVHMEAQLFIANRTHEKAQKLAADFGGIALPLEKITSIDPLVVVNVTSVGMTPHETESPIAADVWKQWRRTPIAQYAFDCIYTPRMTQFLKDAQSAAFEPITGEMMLVQQGAAAFELFTGLPAPIAVMRGAIGI